MSSALLFRPRFGTKRPSLFHSLALLVPPFYTRFVVPTRVSPGGIYAFLIRALAFMFDVNPFTSLYSTRGRSKARVRTQ